MGGEVWYSHYHSLGIYLYNERWLHKDSQKEGEVLGSVPFPLSPVLFRDLLNFPYNALQPVGGGQGFVLW